MVHYCLLVHFLRDTVEVALVKILLGNDLLFAAEDCDSHAVDFTSILADKQAHFLDETFSFQAHLDRYESVDSCVVELTSKGCL